ncbi:MAG: MoaD/ThiS family protein [SAR324 cluster bacterium]|nr:MoaD/ThiS family protein [SAR324 cluster bacterium]MEE1576183.1 MoaD/ThiS family protein [Deltaproteobacteria bacterium]MDP6248893.1 MoaD/ThiS family protein [SAR324 cluster bacterium]MDP6462506.1 MoaD/ThiS family protein [SAR324 cluster bacterium]MDP7139788.1 MoaD/ThiS family protein [SAR324 cluster bacterium]
MIKLNVQLFGILADHLPEGEKGKTILEFEDTLTFKELTKKLGIRRRVNFAVNGEHDLDDTHVLNDGDEVLVFSTVSGG